MTHRDVALRDRDALEGLVLDLWRTTRIDWSFASDSVARAFRERRGLGPAERAFVAETLYGMIRYARTIDEALRVAGHTDVRKAPDRERLIAYLVMAGELTPAEARARVPAVEWEVVAGIDERLAAIKNPVRRVALRCSLPDFLAAALVRDWGDEAEPLARALNQRAPMTVRANTLRTTRDELMAALTGAGLQVRAGELSPAAVHVDTRVNLFGLDAFRAGLFEAQDEGSQLIAELVAPPPRGLVVDFCAGAGGKTLALAAALGNKGRVVAADVDARKLTELRRRARRAGATNVQAVELPAAAALPPALEKLVGAADRVLVDAPCTGVGALRRNPEARWRMQPDDLTRLPALQREIAERALELVAPGGRLVYATCTVLREENEAVVDALLAAHPELEVMPAKAVWGRERADRVTDPDGRYLRVAPHTHGTDGFFAAVLRRKS